jgi:hypothetical protein
MLRSSMSRCEAGASASAELVENLYRDWGYTALSRLIYCLSSRVDLGSSEMLTTVENNYYDFMVKAIVLVTKWPIKNE